MNQFVFVFPIIYYVLKTKKYGLWMMLLCKIMYEILKICYYLEENTYRLLVFRYIFVIAFGCYIYLEKKKNIQLWHVIFMGVGIIYIYITQYMGYQSKIFIYWSSTSVIASLYILPFMVWYIHKGKKGYHF